MLDATGSSAVTHSDGGSAPAARRASKSAKSASRKAAQAAAQKAVNDAFSSAATPAKAFEGPAVAAAAGFMTPFAVAAEATMFWRRSRGLSLCWMRALAKCKSPQDVIETNARYGEKAMALGFGETFRVFERSAMMGRQAAAPASLALRDTD